MARKFRFYLPGHEVSANFTLPQRLSLGVDALVEYTAFLVCLSMVLLPIAIWPTGTSDFSKIISESHYRVLGWAFLISHFAGRLNNYIVYGMAADVYLQNGKRAKFWTVPCKCIFLPLFEVKHWLIDYLLDRHSCRCHPCLHAWS